MLDPWVVASEVQYCKDCPLRGTSEYVAGYGHSNCPVLVVGTAPGATEENTGLAFTGEYGEMLRSILEEWGIEAYYTNVLKRRPKTSTGQQRKPTRQECYKCGSHLSHEIARHKPVVILTVGAMPLSFFAGKEHALQTVHGLPLIVKRFGIEIIVVPAHDPGYVMRQGGLNSKVGNEWLHDIEDFAECVRKKV